MTSRKQQRKINRDKRDMRKFFTTALIVTAIVVLILYLMYRSSLQPILDLLQLSYFCSSFLSCSSYSVSMKLNLDIAKPSSTDWIKAVMDDFDAFLQDHLDCERKASSMAMSFVAKYPCLLYTSPSPRDKRQSRMPSSA